MSQEKNLNIHFDIFQSKIRWQDTFYYSTVVAYLSIKRGIKINLKIGFFLFLHMDYWLMASILVDLVVGLAHHKNEVDIGGSLWSEFYLSAWLMIEYQYYIDIICIWP